MRRSLVRLLFGFSIGLLACCHSRRRRSAIDEFPAAGSPSGLAAGPDGNLWFTQETGNTIGRMTHRRRRHRRVPDPDRRQPALRDRGGPDGDLWFTEFNGNKIGRITTRDGTITEFTVPAAAAARRHRGRARRNLWFTRGRQQPDRPHQHGDARHHRRVSTAVGTRAGRHRRRARTAASGSRADPNTSNNRIGAITTAGAVTDSFSLATSSAATRPGSPPRAARCGSPSSART